MLCIFVFIRPIYNDVITRCNGNQMNPLDFSLPCTAVVISTIINNFRSLTTFTIRLFLLLALIEMYLCSDLLGIGPDKIPGVDDVIVFVHEAFSLSLDSTVLRGEECHPTRGDPAGA